MKYEDFSNYEENIKNFILKLPESIMSKAVIKKFKAKSTIVKKEDAVKNVYLLLKGEFRVINEFSDGNIYAFANILPLNFIGELEVLSGQVVNAGSLVAVTDCIVLQFQLGEFKKCLEENHEFLLLVSRQLANKMYQTSSEIGSVLYYRGIYKVKIFFVRYYQKAKNSQSKIILIDKKRQIIANEIGISEKTVERSIKKLKEENFISVVKGKIYIDEKQYLQLLANIDNYKDFIK